MKIKQENFSTASKMSFTGLNASFYRVRVSAFDERHLEGKPGSMPSSTARQQYRRVDP